MSALRQILASSLAFAVAGCLGTLPPHAYPFEPGEEFVSAAERVCEREAQWGGFHSTRESRFASCMAGVGLNRGRTRGLLSWSPPDGSDGHAEMQACMNATLAQAANLDACMQAAGFSFAPDELIPYRKPGQTRLRESRDQLKLCASDLANLSDRLDREYGECLQEHGWAWSWLER